MLACLQEPALPALHAFLGKHLVDIEVEDEDPGHAALRAQHLHRNGQIIQNAEP